MNTSQTNNLGSAAANALLNPSTENFQKLLSLLGGTNLDQLMASPGLSERFGGQEGATYSVKPGDTLSDIAAANSTDWQTLARINGISNRDLIQAGQQIKLPSGSTNQATSYTVKRGDTLGAIAAANGTTVAALARDNNISNPDRISVGQVLRINGAAGGATGTTGVAPTPTGGAPGASTGRLSENGVKFIYDHEAQRGVSDKLHWPGGASGVTLGASKPLSKMTKPLLDQFSASPRAKSNGRSMPQRGSHPMMCASSLRLGHCPRASKRKRAGRSQRHINRRLRAPQRFPIAKAYGAARRQRGSAAQISRRDRRAWQF